MPRSEQSKRADTEGRRDDGPLFELDGVSFAVDGRTILGPLDLVIGAGEICGLIGPNGSGKSTLVRMLARQALPSGGSIRFLGEAIGRPSDRAFARELAYLPQFTPATDGMTVEELVALGRYPWHGTFGRYTDGDRVKTAAALAETGLEPFRTRRVDSLSGGERQRVWLAMLLAQDTRCLILDEPTSALDIGHQRDVLVRMRALAEQRGLSVVAVLHDINMAARICDRLVALREGQIVADGTPEAVMRPEVLRSIYSVEMSVFPHAVSGAPVGYVL